MCRRFASTLTRERIYDLYGIAPSERSSVPADSKPLYNMAPTQTVPAVRLNPEGRRELAPR